MSDSHDSPRPGGDFHDSTGHPMAQALAGLGCFGEAREEPGSTLQNRQISKIPKRFSKIPRILQDYPDTSLFGGFTVADAAGSGDHSCSSGGGGSVRARVCAR